jgi:hypothetical protein
MPISQGGVYRIKGSHLTAEAGGESINVVVVSSDALHKLGSVWLLPIVIASDGAGRKAPEYVKLDDIKQANVAPGSYVHCANLNARARLVLADDQNIGEREIGRLSRHDWRRVRQAFETFAKNRR